MYIIMNGRSTWDTGHPPPILYPEMTARRRPPPGRKCSPRTPGRCRPHPYIHGLYRSTPGNKGAYALRRIEGDTAHFLMVTFWESEVGHPRIRWRQHERGEIL